jgi:hypothetical protein
VKANATISVSFFQQTPGSDSHDANAPGQAADHHRTAFHFVPPEQAEDGAVLKVHPELQSGSCKAVVDMAAAPGGFVVLCGLLWDSGDGWTGAKGGPGTCRDDGSISWPPKQVVLDPQTWRSLVNTILAGRQVLLEVAR